MRERYAVHYSEAGQKAESDGTPDAEGEVPSDGPNDADNLETDSASEW